MASRGNVPPGKETLKVYIDRDLKRRLRLTAADWNESYSALVERALEWLLENGKPIREVREVEWREDRELLGSDKTGEARMCYSAEMGPDMTGAIYEAADGVCAWYLWDRESGVELAAGQVDSLDEAQEAAEAAAAQHGAER